MENILGKIFGSINEYKVVYINSLVLTLIAIGVLFFCHIRHWIRKLSNPLFYCYLFVFISLIADGLWGLIDGNIKCVVPTYILNIISYVSFNLIGYFWMCFTFNFLPYDCLKKWWVKFLFFIPSIVNIIMIVISPFTHWIFYVNENGEFLRGPLIGTQFIWYCYLFFGSILALISIKKEVLSVNKARLRIIAYSPLPCFFIGGVQMLLPPGCLPSLQFSVFLLLFGIFVHEQEQRITVDTLTRLKTRFEFEKLLNDKIKKIKMGVDKKLFVIAGDVNHFKAINDNFGHDEGDSAISHVGDVMDKIANEYKAVACRRSGDEFLIAIESGSDLAPKEMTKAINNELKKVSDGKGYDLVLSFGIVQYDGSQNLQELVNEADHLMYQEKRIMEGESDFSFKN